MMDDEWMMDEWKKMGVVAGKTGYVAPDILLRLLINEGDREQCLALLDKVEKSDELKLITSLFALYEAFSCIKEGDKLDTLMLRRILQVIDVAVHDELRQLMERPIPSMRIERLRTAAFVAEGR